MTSRYFLLWTSLLILLLFLGCEQRGGSGWHPTGKWEYWGELGGGVRGIVRVEVKEGPFMKYIGFWENTTPLSEKYAREMRERMEGIWERAPEELVQFRGDGFYGYGGRTDGVLYFRWERGTNRLRSAREDSMGVELEPVAEFRAFRFPVELGR